MLKLENTFVSYDGVNYANNNICLNVEDGEFIGVIGSSGSGKSTMIKTINGLVPLKSGEIYIGDTALSSLDKMGLRKIRREIGFIFQDYNLIGASTVIDNVLLGRLGFIPTWKSILGIYSDDDYEIAMKSLEIVGLSEKMFERADNLSGGQMQRVAIAKAMAQKPKIILADEPVSSLDMASAQSVMEYFKAINEKKNITIIVNMHDVKLAKSYVKRIVALKNGEVVFDMPAEELNDEHFEDIY